MRCHRPPSSWSSQKTGAEALLTPRVRNSSWWLSGPFRGFTGNNPRGHAAGPRDNAHGRVNPVDFRGARNRLVQSTNGDYEGINSAVDPAPPLDGGFHAKR